MSGDSLASRATDAFNQHGSFTARQAFDVDRTYIEIRAVDTGELLTTLWPPADEYQPWAWQPTPTSAARVLDSGFSIEQLVRIVATSLLDERPKR